MNVVLWPCCLWWLEELKVKLLVSLYSTRCATSLYFDAVIVSHCTRYDLFWVPLCTLMLWRFVAVHFYHSSTLVTPITFPTVSLRCCQSAGVDNPSCWFVVLSFRLLTGFFCELYCVFVCVYYWSSAVNCTTTGSNLWRWKRILLLVLIGFLVWYRCCTSHL